MTIPLARRVMKARKNSHDRGGSTCALCPGGAGLITRGQQICLITGYGWVHTECARIRRSAASAAPPAQT